MYRTPDRPAVPWFPDKIHWICGRSLAVIGIVEMYLGLNLYQSLYGISPAIVYLFWTWIVIAIGIMVFGQFRFGVIHHVKGHAEAENVDLAKKHISWTDSLVSNDMNLEKYHSQTNSFVSSHSSEKSPAWTNSVTQYSDSDVGTEYSRHVTWTRRIPTAITQKATSITNNTSNNDIYMSRVISYADYPRSDGREDVRMYKTLAYDAARSAAGLHPNRSQSLARPRAIYSPSTFPRQ